MTIKKIKKWIYVKLMDWLHKDLPKVYTLKDTKIGEGKYKIEICKVLTYTTSTDDAFIKLAKVSTGTFTEKDLLTLYSKQREEENEGAEKVDIYV